jgi:hypothetical protein
MLMEGYSLVQKEEIADFHFPTEEVLIKKLDLKEREGALERANALGNLEHQKVRIYFSDAEGSKVVETTIWGVTDRAILLKKNILLPKHRILKLEI